MNRVQFGLKSLILVILEVGIFLGLQIIPHSYPVPPGVEYEAWGWPLVVETDFVFVFSGKEGEGRYVNGDNNRLQFEAYGKFYSLPSESWNKTHIAMNTLFLLVITGGTIFILERFIHRRKE